MLARTTEITQIFFLHDCSKSPNDSCVHPRKVYIFLGFLFFYRNVKKINLLLWMNTFKIMWMSKKHVQIERKILCL